MESIDLEKIKEVIKNKPPEPTEITCLNCSEYVSGSYCSTCGQSVAVKRYTAKGLGREIYSQFRKFEAVATISTFIELVHRPGDYVREYLEGKRVGYANPIKYFFYGFVMQVSAGFVIHLVTGDDTSILTQNTNLGFQITDLVSTFFWGLLWWLLFRRSGLNLVENIVAAIYYTGQTFYFSLIVKLLFGPFMQSRPNLQSAETAVDMIIGLVYTFFFTYGLFGEKGWRLIVKNILAILFYSIFLILLVLLIAVFGVVSMPYLKGHG